MLRAARGNIQDAKIAKNSQFGHHRTTLSDYIFATKACIGSWKKTCKAAISPPHVPTIWQTYGPLASEIGLVVWGTPAHFNGFRVFAALLHSTPVVGVSQTLRR